MISLAAVSEKFQKKLQVNVIGKYGLNFTLRMITCHYIEMFLYTLFI